MHCPACLVPAGQQNDVLPVQQRLPQTVPVVVDATVQVPLWHVWVVQGLPSVLQEVPFALFCSSQLPVTGLQTLTLQGFAFGGHVVVDVTVQVPLWQVWVVQALPSVLQALPFALFCVWQIPEVALQTLS